MNKTPLERANAGFSLPEFLVALMLLLIVFGAVFSLVDPSVNMSMTQPDAIDLSERMRASAETIIKDLAAAGGGLDLGPRTGALDRYFPPVVPRRLGLQNADAATIGRSDAITVVNVPRTSAQSTLSQRFTQPTSDFKVNVLPSCQHGQLLCGFTEGTGLVLFNALGQFDLFTVTQTSGDVAHLRYRGQTMGGAYEVGALAAAVEVHTYYFDSAARQLRHYDGYLTDSPITDNIVGLTFEYFGDPFPPAQPKPPPGVENCLYDASGAAKPMATLAAGDQSSVPLPLAMLRDGPWCGSGSNLFDADLLRIRRIRVTLRAQASTSLVRATGSVFATPGTTRTAERYVPDQTITFEVFPRNLSVR